MQLFENENGELVAISVYTNEAGEQVTQYKTFQGNGVTRVTKKYPDGTTTETFERD